VRNVLWMSGHDVRLYKDDFSGVTTITYRESLPREFAPLLVLDASGSLRLTYELWEKGRGNLVALFSPGKTYTNLTIHHWLERRSGYCQKQTLAVVGSDHHETISS
jgi:hypothetical protein